MYILRGNTSLFNQIIEVIIDGNGLATLSTEYIQYSTRWYQEKHFTLAVIEGPLYIVT